VITWVAVKQLLNDQYIGKMFPDEWNSSRLLVKKNYPFLFSAVFNMRSVLCTLQYSEEGRSHRSWRTIAMDLMNTWIRIPRICELRTFLDEANWTTSSSDFFYMFAQLLWFRSFDPNRSFWCFGRLLQYSPWRYGTRTWLNVVRSLCWLVHWLFYSRVIEKLLPSEEFLVLDRSRILSKF